MALDQRAGYAEAPRGMLSFVVAPGVRIYDGALVGLEGTGTNDGRAQNWSDITGSNDVFVGIARITAETGINTPDGESVIGNTAGTVEVSVDTTGPILRQVLVASATFPNVGNNVFATDENTFTVTPTPALNPIGWITRFHANQICDIQLFSASEWNAANNL